MVFVLQLQNRGLQENRSTHFPCSSLGIGYGNGYRKCSQLKCSKVKVSCMISTNHVKAGKDSHLFRSPVDGSRFAFTVPSHLKLGHLNFMAPVDTAIYGSLTSGFRRSCNNYGSFARRFFSQDASLKSTNENIGVAGKEGGGNTLGFKAFNQHRKRAKVLSAHGKNTAANSNISASKDIDSVTSSGRLVGDGKGDVKLASKDSTSHVNNDNQNSEVDKQLKQQSRNKKNKGQKSAANASEEAVVAKGLKAKRSGASKKSQNSTEVLEVSN